MKFLVLAFSVFVFTGCSWFQSASVKAALQNVALGGCQAETNAIGAAAQKIAVVFQCANVAAIQADVTKFIGNLNVCNLVAPAAQGSVQMKGAIANMLCPLVSSAAIGFATQSIPASWGCTASVAADQVKAALISACELIPY